MVEIGEVVELLKLGEGGVVLVGQQQIYEKVIRVDPMADILSPVELGPDVI